MWITKRCGSWVPVVLLAAGLLAVPGLAAAQKKSAADQAVERGVALAEQGQVEKAAQAFHEAMRLDPKAAPPHVGLGKLLESQKKPKEAEREYREAIRLDENDPEPHLLLGYLLLDRDQEAEARREFQNALVLDETYDE